MTVRTLKGEVTALAEALAARATAFYEAAEMLEPHFGVVLNTRVADGFTRTIDIEPFSKLPAEFMEKIRTVTPDLGSMQFRESLSEVFLAQKDVVAVAFIDEAWRTPVLSNEERAAGQRAEREECVVLTFLTHDMRGMQMYDVSRTGPRPTITGGELLFDSRPCKQMVH